jgi:hypothetical protein
LVGKREEKKPLGRRGVDRRVLRNLPQLDWFWLRIGTGGGLLWTRWWTFTFYRRRGNPSVAERLSAFQEVPCPMKLAGCLSGDPFRHSVIFYSFHTLPSVFYIGLFLFTALNMARKTGAKCYVPWCRLLVPLLQWPATSEPAAWTWRYAVQSHSINVAHPCREKEEKITDFYDPLFTREIPASVGS